MGKHIIVLEDSSKAKFGGGQKISLYVMEELCKYYPITLADIYTTGEETIFQQKAEPFIKESIRLKAYGKIGSKASASYNVGILELLLFPYFLIINLIALRNALKHLSARDIICYTTTKKTLIYAFFMKMLFGYSYVFHMHSAESKNKIVQFLMRIMYNQADSVISVSKFVDKQINLKNSVVIYNPVTSSCLSGALRSIKGKETIIVATFSTLLKYKGIDVFMKSYQYLSRSGRQTRLAIYGDGPEKMNLQKLEEPNVRLCGFVANTEEAMKNIDLLVIPSIAEETFGMTAAEAMSHGIPVIVTNIGGQAEIVTPGVAGIHVRPGHPEDIARAIERVKDDSELYIKLSEGALKCSVNYSFEKFNAAINQVFSLYSN